MKTKYGHMLVMALFASTVVTAVVRADSGHHHDSKAHSHSPSENAHDLFDKVQSTAIKAKADLDAGELKNIHDYSEEIHHLVDHIPEAVSPEKKQRVGGQAANIKKASDLLHHAADENDLDGSRSAYAKLEALLQVMEGQLAR